MENGDNVLRGYQEEGERVSGHVRANDGVGGSEVVADVQGRAAGRHHFVVSSCAGGFKDWLGTGCCQTVEEFSHWG
jgi:hypothetical protein